MRNRHVFLGERRQLCRAALLGLVLLGSPVVLGADDPYREVAGYRFGQSRVPLMAIESEIRTANPEQTRVIEAKLLALLQSPTATKDAKDWICRQLRQVGTEQAAPALASLLTDKDLATIARMALQSIPGSQVDALLREALTRAQGDLQAGVIQTLGMRGDRQAVPLLAPLATAAEVSVAEAALDALGHIGGQESLRAVQAAAVPAALSRVRFHALLLCAERLVAESQGAEATQLYRGIYGQSADPVIRTAALRGLVVTDPANSAPVLAAALKGEQPALRLAAAKFANELAGGEVLRSLVADLTSLPHDVQVLLLSVVRDKAVLPVVLSAIKSGEGPVRVAALGALGRLGNAASVSVLLVVAAQEAGEPQAAARASLHSLPGADVDQAVLAAAQQREPVVRTEAIRALAARHVVAAVPVLLKTAEDPDPSVQTESFAALGTLGDAGVVPALVRLIVEAKSDGQRQAAEAALIPTCRRIPDNEAAADPVVAALPGANAAAQVTLLRVAARVPSAKSLTALRAAVQQAEAAIRDAAIRGLADWPDPAVAPELLTITRSSQSPVHKVLALRGVIRLAGLPSVGTPERAVRLLADALALATRTDEKKLVLAALADMSHETALDLALGCLTDKEVEVEAATSVVKIAKRLQKTKPDAAAAAIKKTLDVCQTPAARQVAESTQILIGDLVNIAPLGTASSPDDLAKDGGAGDDQAGIDGDQATYWDEQDGQKLYRFVVTFKQPEPLVAVSIVGYSHHDFAPKDFEILCDGKTAKRVENAQYDDNFLVIRLDPVTCTSVELKISGYYGGSPAIRELGLYRTATKR
jgi:HEAT repeat protein